MPLVCYLPTLRIRNRKYLLVLTISTISVKIEPQSAEASSYKTLPELAIDGDPETKFHSELVCSREWFKITFHNSSLCRVHEIVLINGKINKLYTRLDQAKIYTVVDDVIGTEVFCGTVTVVDGMDIASQTYTIKCESTVLGRGVIIYNRNNIFLELREFAAYGTCRALSGMLLIIRFHDIDDNHCERSSVTYNQWRISVSNATVPALLSNPTKGSYRPCRLRSLSRAKLTANKLFYRKRIPYIRYYPRHIQPMQVWRDREAVRREVHLI